MRLAWTIVLIASAARAQFAPGDLRPWEDADRAVVRLPPNVFPALPSGIVADLTRRGCTIPQVPLSEAGKLQNVIRGEFAKPGQTDWAVLCSVKRVSSILVYWEGSVTNVSEIEKRKDIDFLQGWGGTRIIYDRHLAPVGPAYIREHHQAYGGPEPPPLDHQGVDDQTWGKASVVQYFYQGKWLHLTGAD